MKERIEFTKTFSNKLGVSAYIKMVNYIDEFAVLHTINITWCFTNEKEWCEIETDEGALLIYAYVMGYLGAIGFNANSVEKRKSFSQETNQKKLSNTLRYA